MNTEKIFPFTWTGWDPVDVMINQYYTIEFVEDFGKIKAGKYNSACVDMSKGIIEIYTEDGRDVLITQEFKTIPI